MITYGEDTWDPMGEETNSEFEKYLCEIVSEVYIEKWAYLNDRFGYERGADIAIPIKEFIHTKSQKSEGFSIVRMNDGEGSVLLDTKQEKLKKYVVGRISKILYGEPNVVLDDLDENRRLLMEAITSADIIGAPEKTFIQRRLVEEEKSKSDVRAICGSFNQINLLYKYAKENRFNDEIKITSVWLSKYLLAHYTEIFNFFSRLVIITGNIDLANKMKKNMYSGEVIEILIPTQRAKRSNNNISHWPERFEQVLIEIEKLPGYSLVLVAAGILGKAYCHHAKKHGHGAIDIGHVADIWDGRISRPGVDNQFISKWKLG